MTNLTQHRKGVLLTIAAGVLVPMLFVFFYVFPTHSPSPNRLPVGVVAPLGRSQAVAAAYTRQDHGFSIRTFSHVADAREAISDREIYGAFLAPHGRMSAALVSGGQSMAVANLLRQRARTAGVNSVQDVTPLVHGDRLGVTLNTLVLAVVIAAVLGALLSMQFAPWLLTGQRLLVSGAIGVLAASGIIGFVHLLDALPGSVPAEIAALALGVMSIALTAAGIIRLVGPLRARASLPAAREPVSAALRTLRARHRGPGDRRARRPRLHPAQLSGCREGISSVLRQDFLWSGLDRREYMQQTPLMVGSPQQIIDRYAGMRETFGDYQRQLFLLNLPGMPMKVAREQLDALAEVVPILRRELDRGRPAGVPAVPTHASRLAARDPAMAWPEAA